MYTRAQISKKKQDFWTAFGLYMKPVPSAEGQSINWKNYNTGIKKIFFRMRAEIDSASIGIEIAHPDPEIQELIFDQFIQFQKLLKNELGEEWDWKLLVLDENEKIISKIEKNLGGVNVMEINDWPKIISFLKPRIIALDNFWANVKYGFDGLV